MKRILSTLVVLPALSLAGCLQQAASDLSAAINTFDSTVNSPANQAALASLRATAGAVTCQLAAIDSNAMALGGALQTAISKKQAAIVGKIDNGVNVLYVINSTLCKQLGGTTTAPTTGG
jgi:Skp family chaperone for outer membrane proteins